MRRSTVNLIMKDAVEHFARQNFFLPPFAYWTPSNWLHKGPEVEQIVKNGLGWDITDYGLNLYWRYGLLLFTLRNGNSKDELPSGGKPYCEKIMLAEPGQEHQTHFHRKKVEDIINRGGGVLAIRLYNASSDDQLADSDVCVYVNDVRREMAAGSVLLLEPGESITISPRLYHKFWAQGERVMIGEVSTINDDSKDNHFYQMIGTGRFSEIVEDEEPLYPLFSDVHNYWRAGRADDMLSRY